ncbi:MAG TPA: putative collagen-binding domain-containing protein, partial [Flavihumibacter sp.]|nr:putative collagen-binding domain-containing protein [Flavihumibacter sp.]
YITAFRDSVGRYMMVYIPEGKTITVNTSCIKSEKIKTTWFDPKTGKTGKSSLLSNQQQMVFTTPVLGKGNDWVLIVDDANEKFR